MADLTKSYEKNLVEASTIFTIRPSNIQQIPKVIFFFGKMYLIIAISARKSPI